MKNRYFILFLLIIISIHPVMAFPSCLDWVGNLNCTGNSILTNSLDAQQYSEAVFLLDASNPSYSFSYVGHIYMQTYETAYGYNNGIIDDLAANFGDNIVRTYSSNSLSFYPDGTSVTIRILLYNINDNNASNFTLPSSSDSFTATGKVTYRDVENSTGNLEGALVYYNSTINDTTDVNGDYSISEIPNGITTLSVIKSDAFSTDSGYVSESSTVLNFELDFSKPQINKPYVDGDYLKGRYTHNFKTMDLWENPSFVWGKYYFYDLVNTSNDKFYYKQCVSSGGDTFACEFIPDRNYSFNFVYSDHYNSNLATYHPTLTGMRNFTSDIFYSMAAVDYQAGGLQSISVMSQVDREKTLKNSFPDIIFLLLLFITVGMAISFKDRK